MIDEKKLIMAIANWQMTLNPGWSSANDTDTVTYNTLEEVVGLVEDQPTIQPQGIDKDRLIDELETIKYDTPYNSDSELGWNLAVNNTVRIIKNQSTVNQQPTSDGWIPCSERLPDKDNSYEVTVEYADGTRTTTTLWFDKDWAEWHHAEATAIAWRERLPQPYKESE